MTVHVDAAAAHAVLPFSETEWLAFRRTGTTSVDIPDLLASPHFPNTFSLGVIVGPSGSGKSRILSNLRDAATAPQVPMTPWSATDSVRSYFGVHVDILRELGLPERVWSLPFPALSVGEQSRAALARQLLEATAFESAAGITAPSRSSLMLGQSGTRLDASMVVSSSALRPNQRLQMEPSLIAPLEASNVATVVALSSNGRNAEAAISGAEQAAIPARYTHASCFPSLLPPS